MSQVPLPRLWCCASSEAPGVAVFVRCHASVRAAKEYRDSAQGPAARSGTRWSCVLKWDWKTGALTEGSWTSMEIRPLRSMVSACGEFHLFHAKTHDDGPFSARLGPRYAVARLPWLAPLTHPQSFGPGGAGLSQHALSKAQQERLWTMFAGFFWRQTDDEWPRHLTAGPVNPNAAEGWHAVAVDDPAFEGTGFVQHLLPKPTAEVPEPTLAPHLIAVYPIAVQATSGTQVSLVAAVPRSPSATGEPGLGWNVWEGQLRFFILVRSVGASRIEPLDGVRWAKPTRDGRLLTASADCRLRVLRWGPGFGASTWQILQEHDLSGLAPNPISPPREALAGLR